MSAVAAPSYGAKASIGATPLALATSTVICTGVVIKALASNSGTVYVGNDSNVATSTGFPLAAGDQQSFDIKWFLGWSPATSANAADLASIYVVGSTTGQEVRYWFV